jgi:hypothetical protein|eukprot:SAG25_NODE_892_length_4894_cov_8.055892_5_plen_68_part_00
MRACVAGWDFGVLGVSAPRHVDAVAFRSARAHGVLRSKRLLIESRWVSTPLAFAGKRRPRRLNNEPF